MWEYLADTPTDHQTSRVTSVGERPSSSIDWASLQETVGVDLGSANCALALILGEDNLRSVADTYVTFESGWIVAESVADHLESEATRDRCIEIWRAEPDLEKRRIALEMLPALVHREDLPVIGELLNDADEMTRWHGIRCVTQLAYGHEFAEHESEFFLDHLAETQDEMNPDVEVAVGCVLRFLAGLLPVASNQRSDRLCSQLGVQWAGGPCVGPIDWPRVDATLRTGSSGGTRVAQMALELVIGPDRFRDAVDWCVAGRQGSELARLVLEDVKPPSAGDRCIEIFRSDKDLQSQLAAVSVLRLVAVNRQLPIVKDLFDRPHPTLQEDGAAILESLVESRLQSDADPEPFIALAEGHSNELVRHRAQKIRSEWAEWP